MNRASFLIFPFMWGCTHAVTPAVPGADTTTAPALDVRSVRVLDENVNLMEPLDLAVLDGAVSISFASRGHETTRVVLDPGSLETRGRTSFAHADHPAHKIPPCTVGRKRAAQVMLSGEAIDAWTDFEGRVVTARQTGDAIPISPPEWAVVGRPRAVAIDDHRAVVAFFAGNDEHYRVIAVIIDTAPARPREELTAR